MESHKFLRFCHFSAPSGVPGSSIIPWWQEAGFAGGDPWLELRLLRCQTSCCQSPGPLGPLPGRMGNGFDQCLESMFDGLLQILQVISSDCRLRVSSVSSPADQRQIPKWPCPSLASSSLQAKDEAAEACVPGVDLRWPILLAIDINED